MTTQLIPVKTRRMLAPKDDLYDVFAESMPPLQEEDIVVVTSKVVAIHQGRCIDENAVEAKDDLVEQEAEWFIPRASSVYGITLSINEHMLISSAGIDHSNGNGYYILLPSDPCEAAQEIQEHLKKKFNLQKLGVVITDSHCLPLRRGVMGVSIGFHGFEPLYDYRDKKDAFGRDFTVVLSNHPDAIGAAAVGVMGEGDECIPIAIVRDWPRVTFTDKPCHEGFLIPLEEDLFEPLLSAFKTLGKKGKKKTSTSSR